MEVEEDDDDCGGGGGGSGGGEGPDSGASSCAAFHPMLSLSSACTMLIRSSLGGGLDGRCIRFDTRFDTHTSSSSSHSTMLSEYSTRGIRFDTQISSSSFHSIFSEYSVLLRSLLGGGPACGRCLCVDTRISFSAPQSMLSGESLPMPSSFGGRGNRLSSSSSSQCFFFFFAAGTTLSSS